SRQEGLPGLQGLGRSADSSQGQVGQVRLPFDQRSAGFVGRATIMATPILFIGKDKDALAERAAEFITKTAGDVLHSRESFTIALTGGSTPEQTYRLLARADRSARIDWRRTL